jgi:hypothetical protein
MVTRDGEVHQLIQLPNVVPTGLDVKGAKVYLALAGPVPHRPEDGRIVSFRASSPEVRDVASGAPLLVDVERCGHRLFGLAQGDFPEGQPPGSPALPTPASCASRTGTAVSGCSSAASTGRPRSRSSEARHTW